MIGYVPKRSGGCSRWDDTLAFVLLDAVQNGDEAHVSSLLKLRADPDVTESWAGQSILHVACKKDLPKMVKVLCEASANVDARNERGLTPIALALYSGLSEIPLTLLDAGANPRGVLSLSSNQRFDALRRFLPQIPSNPSKQQCEVVRLLLRKYAGRHEHKKTSSRHKTQAQARGPKASQDANDIRPVQGSKGEKAPLDKAHSRQAVMSCVVGGWFGGLKALLNARANPGAVDQKSRRNARELADALLDTKISDLLRAHGASALKQPGHAEWALCLAAARGDNRAVAIWAAVADTNWREPPPGERYTALMHAGLSGHEDAARIILKHGANAALLDKNHQSAAALARANGHNSLAELLEDQARDDIRRLTYERGGNSTQIGALRDRIDLEIQESLLPEPATELSLDEDELGKVNHLETGRTGPSQLQVTIVSATEAKPAFLRSSVSAYATCAVGNVERRTKVSDDAVQPAWNESFQFLVLGDETLFVSVWDEAQLSVLWGSNGEGDRRVGWLDVPLEEHCRVLASGGTVRIEESLKGQEDDDNAVLTFDLVLVRGAEAEEISDNSSSESEWLLSGWT